MSGAGRGRWAVVLGAIVGIAAIATLGLLWQRAERRERAALLWTHTVMDSLVARVPFPGPVGVLEARDSLYWVWAATHAQLQMRRWQRIVQQQAVARGANLRADQLEMLRREGLTVNPVEQLRDSLMARPDLIPMKGVLGGTMNFYSREDIVLISPNYAFAAFDDGHIGGAMLLRFSIQGEGGRIHWEPLWWTGSD